MHIANINLVASTHHLTLSADICFQGKQPESIFFSVQKQFEHYIVADASPFLAAVLLPCMKTGEEIVIDGTISAEQLAHTQELMDLVAEWNVGLKKVKINARNVTKDDFHPQGIASFFSAGVDSFYTYLKHKRDKEPINHLILVHGFDIPLANTSFFEEVKTTVTKIAQKEHVTPVFVTTNIADSIEKRLVWDFAHGGALAAVGLFLRGGLKKVYISGAVKQDELFPYGTHPELDPLWSTEHLDFRHDGTEHNRLGKIMHRIAPSPLALSYLRVCTQNIKGAYNCSRCYKCLQTMIGLICAGASKNAKTFIWPIDLDAVRDMYYDYDLKYNKQGEANLEILRRENREPDLQAAIRESLEKSKHPGIAKRLAKTVATFDQKYNDRRLYRFAFAMNAQQDRNIFFKMLMKMGVLK